MAKIALRTYNREIEEIIASGNIDEAINHCRHILQGLPKHLESYRLLGKAYLEGQRYGDAADIFQRVLSSKPDEFIAHVGMSIIREDEGNLDAAIWHMERAFEVQPSNQAIQDELRRLYGQRDGIEPPKIRLTRGALARMYAHGDLYNQAIAELRAALAEDPQRPDLQVLLAEMHFKSGKKVEAAEVCNQLLRKLPYCYDANSLLAEILEESGRAAEVSQYVDRVNELDPYAAHISATAPHPADVADGAVTVDRLDLGTPTSDEVDQPAWASSLGVDMLDRDENVPDWLADADEGQPAPAGAAQTPFTSEPPTIPAAGPAEEPDWVNEIGSQEPGSVTDSLDDQPLHTKEFDTGEIATATSEVPDWTKEGPSGEAPASEERQAVGETGEEDVPDWLNELEPVGDTPDERQTAESDDWLQDIKDSTAGLILGAADTADEPAEEPAVATDDLPDWLQSSKPSTGELSGEGLQPPAQQEDDWLSDIKDSTAGLILEAADSSDQPAPQDATGALGAPEGGTDWLSDIKDSTAGLILDAADTADVPPPTPDATPAVEDAGATDWLSDIKDSTAGLILDAADTADVDPPFEEAPPADTPVDAPIPEPEEAGATDWLQDVKDSTAGLILEAADSADDLAPVSSTGVLPEDENADDDWLSDIKDSTAGLILEAADTANVESGQETGSIQPDQEDVPEWLRNVQTTTGDLTTSELPVNAPPEPEEDGATDWLGDIKDSTAGLIVDAADTAHGDDDEVPATPPGATGSLGAPEGATDWLSDIKDSTAGLILDAADTASTDAPPGVQETEGSDDWLSTLGTADLAEAEEIGAAPLQEIKGTTDWLIELSGDDGSELKDDSEPDWMKESSTEQEAATEETTAEETPDWIKDLDNTEGQEASSTEVTGEEEAPVNEEEAMAWLEGLAAKQGVAEEELVTDPEERPEDTPAWAQAEEAVSSPDAGEDEAPAWLDDLSAEPEATAAEPVAQAESSDEDEIGNDEAMAWLEGLAADQGADEQELLSDPKERPEEVPEWAQAEAETETPAVEPEPNASTEEASPEGDEDALAWLDDLVVGEEAETPQEPAQEPAGSLEAEEDGPEWLTTISEEAAEEATASSGDSGTEEGAEVPEWLASADEEEKAQEAEEADMPQEFEQSVEAAAATAAAWMPEDLDEDAADAEAKSKPATAESNGKASKPKTTKKKKTSKAKSSSRARPSTKRRRSKKVDADLNKAREDLNAGRIDTAVERYEQIIKSFKDLEEIVADIEAALYKHPVDIQLWQMLGDTYLKADRLQEALDSYNKAEDLIRA